MKSDLAHRTCQHRYYFMTCAQFDALIVRSNRCCEICGAVKPLVIDHDHNVGFNGGVRGLICSQCNALMAQVDGGHVLPDEQVAVYLSVTLQPARKHVRRYRSVKGQTPTRSLRIPPDLWDEAILAAERKGTTLTALTIAYYHRLAKGKP